MTPAEALGLLDNTVSKVSMDRQAHAVHMHAIKILQIELDKLKKKEETSG